ncbi:MAG: NAD-dependent epimerase/dehydratase family protein [Chlamydiia bacterium]|nr:NAD-dependent epimerase/dehydratase family protein [Chlamydiia bacterium]
MKIAVTGATGFVGGHLARRLHSLGYKVLGLGRDIAKGQALVDAGLAFKQVDLSDAHQCTLALAGQDAVIHCAAFCSPWGSHHAFYSGNVLATRYVADACLKGGVERLIHVSSPSIYFDGTDRIGIDEHASIPDFMANTYALTKWQSEIEVLQAQEEGLKLMIFRPRGIFGAGDTTILPRLIEANQKGRLPLFRKGQAWIDLTHVDNVVDALIAGLMAPDSAWGQDYNISNDDPRTVADLLHLLFDALDMELRTRSIPVGFAKTIARLLEWGYARLSDKEPPFTPYSVGLLSTSMTLDITKAEKNLGYMPRVSIEEGIEDFARWWRAQNA